MNDELNQLIGDMFFIYSTRSLERLKETAQLELGSEIVQGTLEQFVTVKVGDDLHKIMNTEILLENGKVISFRN